jgi:myo-inositol-1(or 4)-monophosphatase
MNLDHIMATARDAARGAASMHCRHLGSVSISDWDTKGFADFVSHVDREAESLILERIHATFPAHSVLAEEASSRGTLKDVNGEWLWVIDPLDGTTNYLHNYPMFAVSIAVLHRFEPVAGVVVNSSTGEEWTATRGGGAFRNGSPIRVSAIETLDRALIGTGFPYRTPGFLPEYLEQLGLLLRAGAGVRRAGAAALDLCHVASGWFDGFWELSLAPWDVAAGTLVIREAGGVVTRLSGSCVVFGQGSIPAGNQGSILAGNPSIHRALSVRIGGREPRSS